MSIWSFLLTITFLGIFKAYNAHDATAQALKTGDAINAQELVKFGNDVVVGDFLFDPTLKAICLHICSQGNLPWD